MALTKTITELFPSGSIIGVHLKLEDDERLDLDPTVGMEHTVIDVDITEFYTKADGPTAAVKNSIKKKINARIKEYERLKALFASSQYTNAVNDIRTNTIS